MSDLIVTFGRRDGALEAGANARTEVLVISGSREETDLSAGTADNVVTLYAEADCWIAIGKSPNAENGVIRRFLPSSSQKRFSIRTGEVVSVVAHS